MDFYTNDYIARMECQRRAADLYRDAKRPFKPQLAGDREAKRWSKAFATWIAARARKGCTFMARTPMNP